MFFVKDKHVVSTSGLAIRVTPLIVSGSLFLQMDIDI